VPSRVGAMNCENPNVLPVCPYTVPQEVWYRKMPRPAELVPGPVGSDLPALRV
jgi:hypothetical protein